MERGKNFKFLLRDAALLYAKGVNLQEIRRALGLGINTVRNYLESPAGMAEVARFAEYRETRFKTEMDRLQELTEKSLDVFEEIFDAPVDHISLVEKGRFAEFFLKNMSGLQAPQRVQVEGFSRADLEEFRDRGLEALKSANPVIDAEVVNESD